MKINEKVDGSCWVCPGSSRRRGSLGEDGFCCCKEDGKVRKMADLGVLVIVVLRCGRKEGEN